MASKAISVVRLEAQCAAIGHWGNRIYHRVKSEKRQQAESGFPRRSVPHDLGLATALFPFFFSFLERGFQFEHFFIDFVESSVDAMKLVVRHIRRLLSKT